MGQNDNYRVGGLSLRHRVTLQDKSGTEFTGIVIELSLLGDSDEPTTPDSPVMVTLRTDDGGEMAFQRIISDRVTLVWA